jgi:hypothetical protein
MMPEISQIIILEKDRLCSDQEAIKMLDAFLSICGLIDTTFSALLVIGPSEDEILDAEKKIKKLMSVWREHKMSVTLKAYILEHHMIYISIWIVSTLNPFIVRIK